MNEAIFIQLGFIVVLGILSQWVAWRLHLPSIILLLVTGFIFGSLFHLIDPDAIFGQSLFPLVSLSVAIILFEGGLNLSFREIRGKETVLVRLITIGVLVTFGLITLAAYYLLQLDLRVALLLGAILVVTGPTVIIPLLHSLRVQDRLSSLIYWEGIVNDPIGASLAVIVFEVIVTSGGAAFTVALWAVLKTVFIGGLVGAAGAWMLIQLMRRYWIPDFLHNPFSLMMLVVVFGLSNHFQDESGLLAVTVMGIVLANQQKTPIRHILEFKENLRVILISVLFIILAARLPLEDLPYWDIRAFLFLAVVILVARPAAVFLSTLGSTLKWKERVFLFWMAPRGIVAAAVSSILGIYLVEVGIEDGNKLMAYTFLVIVGTVLFYGLTAGYVARRLKLAYPDPQGLFFVGAHRWARVLAKFLKKKKFPVLLVDTNKRNVTFAKKDGLRCLQGNPLQESFQETLDMSKMGYLLAVTSNDEVNSLVCLHYREEFGRSKVFQLPSDKNLEAGDEAFPGWWQGRIMFSREATFDVLDRLIRDEASIQSKKFSEEENPQDFLQGMQDRLIPLFIITAEKKILIWGVDNPPTPEAGDTLFYLERS